MTRIRIEHEIDCGPVYCEADIGNPMGVCDFWTWGSDETPRCRAFDMAVLGEGGFLITKRCRACLDAEVKE